MIYHVTCSTDDYYVQHCMAMLCSLFENNRKSEFCIHLLMDNLSQNACHLVSELCAKYNNSVTFYQIDKAMMEGIELSDLQFNGRPAYSIATYYRMLLPTVIPRSVRRILYLDCDIIVLGDVDELYQLNLSNNGLAAVYDCTPYDSYHRFKMGLGLNHNAFCAGMMMINLDYWRENNSQKELFEYANRTWESVYMQDQDALNYVFRDNWLMLPYKWGKTPLSVAPVDSRQKMFDLKEYVYTPNILHYSAHVKPWLDVWFPLRKHYWKYVMLSGYPDPKVTKTNLAVKKRIYNSLMRYFLNKYIRPFVPDTIELLIRDIVNLLLPFVYIISPHRLKDHMLKRWAKKYQM